MAAGVRRKRSTSASAVSSGRRGCYALTVGLGLLQLCLVLGTAWRFTAFLQWQQQQQQGEEKEDALASVRSRLRGRGARPAYVALSAADAAGASAQEEEKEEEEGQPPPPAAPRHRVAVLLPFLGRDFPPWFPAFADACGGSGSSGGVGVDWVVLHEGTRLPFGYTPPANVRLVNLGPDGACLFLYSTGCLAAHHRSHSVTSLFNLNTGLATAFLQEGVVLPRGTPAAEREEALRLLKAHFANTPAMLIQFKVRGRETLIGKR